MTSPTREGIIRIAFGHCTWAVPLVLAMRDLVGFEFTSFKSRESGEPVWMASGDCNLLRDRKYPGPTDTHLVPMSADEILTLLDHDVAQVCAVPGRLVEEGDRAYTLVATIVDSGPGCSYLMDASQHQVLCDLTFSSANSRVAFTTSEIAGAIRLSCPKSMMPVIIAEQGTVGVSYAQEIEQHLGRTLPLRVFQGFQASALQQASSFATIEENMRKRFPNGKLVGIIAWEPHASWLRSRDEAVRDVLLQYAPRPGFSKTPKTNLTFDLVITDKSRPHARVMELVTDLWTLLQKRSLGNLTIPDADLLAGYFGFDQSNTDVASIIGRTRYCVYPRLAFTLNHTDDSKETAPQKTVI